MQTIISTVPSQTTTVFTVGAALLRIKQLIKECGVIQLQRQKCCADRESDTPEYGPKPEDQRKHMDLLGNQYAAKVLEIGQLKYRIQKTNAFTLAQIRIGNNYIKMTVAEWIVRRQELADLEALNWTVLTNRGLTALSVPPSTPGGQSSTIGVRLYYDQAFRDAKVAEFTSEPSLIDQTLGTVNNMTPLMALGDNEVVIEQAALDELHQDAAKLQEALHVEKLFLRSLKETAVAAKALADAGDITAALGVLARLIAIPDEALLDSPVG